MDAPTLGIVATSRKPDEKRVALHPAHLDRVEEALRERIVLERGYGERFGIPDAELAPRVSALLSRDQLMAACDIVVLPKPMPEDFAALNPGQVLWGWPHLVQDVEVTQIAIDRRLTLIAWEAMHLWHGDGGFRVHVFHRNNELAGYCSVLQALQLRGLTGAYGPELRAVVIGFGATGRGAVSALLALQLLEVTVLTHRSVPEVVAPIPGAHYHQYEHDGAHAAGSFVLLDGRHEPLADYLAEHDVIVNCILQDPEHPVMFLANEDLPRLRHGCTIVDVSCDEGMGFPWARPTSFATPTFEPGPGVTYYGVDHSPSYLWNSTTWEISEALLSHLPVVMGGPSAWEADETIFRAIEIRDGTILNPRILSFQGRSAVYPYPPVTAGRPG